MRDSVRRLLLFSGIISVGIILIFAPLPIHLSVFTILLIAFFFGIIFLFLTGSLSFKQLLRRRGASEEKKKEPVKRKGPTFREKCAEKLPSFYNAYLKVERLFSPLGGAIRGIRGRIRRPKREKVPAASNPPQISTGSAGTVAGIGSAALADEADDLLGDISFDELDDEVFGDLEGEGSLLDRADSSHIDAAGGEMDDAAVMEAAAQILAQEGALDDEPFEDDDFSPGIDLDPFGDVDLDAIDLDALGDDDPEAPDLDMLKDEDEPEEPETTAAGVPSTLKEKKGGVLPFGDDLKTVASNVGIASAQDTMASESYFQRGAGLDDGDILSELKRTTKEVRKQLDLSLVRDLKDVTVTNEELVEELSMVVTALGIRKKAEESTPGR